MTDTDDWSTRRRLVPAVAADIRHVASLRGQLDEQFVRRSIIRTTFSLIDAFCYYLKREALLEAVRTGIAFKGRMLRVLTERRAVDDNDGGAGDRPYYPTPSENVRFSIRAYCCVRGCDVPDWIKHLSPAFSTCKVVRDRITHPKAADELEISDAEARAGDELLAWLLAVHGWQSDQEVQYIERLKRDMHAMFEKSKRRILDSVAASASKGTEQ